jgi:hypothetical protein
MYSHFSASYFVSIGPSPHRPNGMLGMSNMWRPKVPIVPKEGPAEESYAQRSQKDFVRDEPIGKKCLDFYVYDQKGGKPHVL